jgi:hypothetical protein
MNGRYEPGSAADAGILAAARAENMRDRSDQRIQ